MKTLVCIKPGELVYEDRAMPVTGPHEVLLKIKAVGICGTDIHAYNGKQPFFSYPRVLGHEIAGEVVSVGLKTNSFAIGDRVAVMPCISCGTCTACRAGRTNCCENISLYGVHQDGGFTEYLVVKASNLIRLNDSISYKRGACIEPFTIAAHAVKRGQITATEDVLIVGAGLIGIGVAAVAKAAGANVVVADIQDSRLKHVEKILALQTINSSAENFEDRLRTRFKGKLPSVLFDVTGNKTAMTNAVNYICHGGRLVFVGLYVGDLQIDDPTFHKKETTLLSSRNSTRKDFEKVVAMMSNGLLDEAFMINFEYDFATLGERYEADVVNNKDLIKGVILFDEQGAS